MDKAGRKIGAVALAATFAGVPVIRAAQQAKGGKDTATTDAQGQFFCNIKALTPAERARLKDLGGKMAAARTAAVETERGYEFQYNPEKISVGEVAEWVVTENKCCSFYDFHIDLEEGGKLICLRLTGSQGIKTFIRSEFHL
jgi:hypothetical protein